jgi:hypothetical protein
MKTEKVATVKPLEPFGRDALLRVRAAIYPGVGRRVLVAPDARKRVPTAR